MDKKTLEIQIKLLANQALTQVKEFSNDIKNAADKAKGFTGDAKGVATSIKTMQAEAQRTANQLKLFGLTSSDLRNTTQNLKKTILDLTDSGLKPESKEVQKVTLERNKKRKMDIKNEINDIISEFNNFKDGLFKQHISIFEERMDFANYIINFIIL